MIKPSHTPGPWEYCGEKKGKPCPCRIVWSIPEDCPVFTAGSNSQALIGLAHHKWGDDAESIYGEIPEEQRDANARIIAAAPDMLGALKSLMGLISRNELVRNVQYDLDRKWCLTQIPFVVALKAADDAIAKAEGRP